ncbi:uncharacterized protein V6R79_015952 [Siganus canaliculatus]
MFHMRSSSLILLLMLQFVAVSWAQLCGDTEANCDFVCDCPGCSDEQNCGYIGQNFQCDFEDAGMCGWKDQSLNAPVYSWQRRQRGHAMPDKGPDSDYTTGTATGWYMGVTAVRSESVSTAVLISPLMRQSSPTCRLRLRYFLWDSGRKGLGSSPLWATVIRQDSQEAVVWRPEATSVRGWRESTIFLGRFSTAFQIRLHSQRTVGQEGDVAIDHMEFLDCALPLPLPGEGEGCVAGMLECNREGCVAERQICDGTDDCGDGTDEDMCGDFNRCDFENGLCGWDLTSLSNLTWVRTNQMSLSVSDPLIGPGRDHSNNSVAGHFLYVTVPDGGLKSDWAAFQSPPLQPTNSTHPCKMVMYTHQFGPRSGGLSVLVADRAIYPVWKRGGAVGDVWVKAEVEIVTDDIFQILIVAAIRDFEYGGIAIDSIVLSPECRLSNESNTPASFPKPPGEPCTTHAKMCDFQSDCEAAEDEAKCGDFSYADGSSGWTDASIGGQGWQLFKNSTSGEEYLYIAAATGQQLTNAQTRTPLLGPSGPTCTLSFDFALAGNPAHIGEMSVRVIDSVMGTQPELWEFGGKTGTDPESWRNVTITIGARENRFQLEFEARARKLCSCSKLKVRNVRFHNCHANYVPSTSTALSCNFESGLCGWYQDKSDNFDWTELDGMDHTIAIGRSLVVDMWSPSLRGAAGRLISFTQLPSSGESCLTFYYKIYGPNTGVLNVKLVDNSGFETILWTRSGAHGNMWHKADCPVPHQLSKFKLVFEAVRSGFDGRVAIDDVSFADRTCSAPTMCSFEGNKCGFTTSGNIQWLHRNGQITTTTGPKTDHTLETALGFYMMVNTGANNLPSGSTSALTSSIRSGIVRTECVQFWYHMRGENPGTLSLYVKPVRGERVKIFSDSLNQGNSWRHGSANVEGTLMDWQLEFEVVGAGGKDTHVAVDDILISSHSCESQDGKCSLEKGMCSWSNTQNVDMDKLDWELTNQAAEKHYSIPSVDHTLGTERGHFLFFPSTSRSAANENAKLLSPHLPSTKGTCLRFWGFKPLSSDSVLYVWRLSEGLLTELLVVRDLGAAWKRFEIDIKSDVEYQIVFEGVEGASGFVALDDIEYTIGVNCANEIMDPHLKPSKSSNAGATAAIIMVVLLLIGTLAVLLIFYLRKPRPSTPPAPASSPRGFTNEIYEPDTSDHVKIPNHPMAAGVNNVTLSADGKEMEV